MNQLVMNLEKIVITSEIHIESKLKFGSEKPNIYIQSFVT